MGKSVRLEAGSLLRHPNQVLPEVPGFADSAEFAAGVVWGVVCAASFISPPKLEGEDEEFRCEDLAQALRGAFLRELLDRISGDG